MCSIIRGEVMQVPLYYVSAILYIGLISMLIYAHMFECFSTFSVWMYSICPYKCNKRNMHVLVTDWDQCPYAWSTKKSVIYPMQPIYAIVCPFNLKPICAIYSIYAFHQHHKYKWRRRLALYPFICVLQCI